MRGPSSLNAQLTLAIGLLAGLPNLAFAVVVLVPELGGPGALGAQGWILLGAWTVLVVGASIGIGYGFTRALLRPLTRASAALASRAREDEGGGSLAPLEAAPDDPSEIRGLKAAFNALLTRIRTERSRRDAFMATIAHDLKTPLVATGSVLKIIRDHDELSREERVDLATRLEHENQTVIDLVQTLLDAYRYEQRSVPLVRERVDLGAIARRAAERVRSAAEARGVAIDVEGGAQLHGDPAALERAIDNLVANAVRYAERRIVVEVYNGLVRIVDDGPGLPEPLERLSEPFASRRLSFDGRPVSAGSAGMGLFIARRILEMHGGRLVCERSDARGTVLLAYVGGSGREAVGS